jgi:hypothetical protein
MTMKIDNYLEYYYRKYKIHFRVQRFFKFPCPWHNYKDPKYEWYTSYHGEPNHREVLPSELCLDLDYHSVDASFEEVEEAQNKTVKDIKERLTTKKISYTLWKSGGTGFHFHIFFDELLNYGKYERDEIKRLLLRDICYGYLTHHDGQAHIHLTPMIQIENARSRKGGMKSLKFSEDFGSNQIDESVLIKYDVEKAMAQYTIKKIPLTNGEPADIKYFLSNDMVNTDGKKRVAFILASWFAQQGLSENECYDKICEWNSYTLRGYLFLKQIKATVKGVYKSKRRVSQRYRNELLKEIGVKLK